MSKLLQKYNKTEEIRLKYAKIFLCRYSYYKISFVKLSPLAYVENYLKSGSKMLQSYK